MECDRCYKEDPTVAFMGQSKSYGPDLVDAENTKDNLPGGFAWLCETCRDRVEITLAESLCPQLVMASASEAHGTPIYRECGQDFAGERQLCDKHQKEAEERYPQGWRYHPGDLCKHGVYTGGCGPDYMCGQCENGG